MSVSLIGVLALGTVSFGQPAAPPDSYYAALSAATRELSNQMFYLQRGLATIPGPPEGRGLYNQIDKVNLDLNYFQNQLQQKASVESLYVAFDPLNGRLNAFLSEIKNAEKWSPFLRMVARRVRFAQGDVQFAMAAVGGTPERQAQLKYMQTLVLLDRTEDLNNMVGWVMAGQGNPGAWKAAFGSLHSALKQLEQLQKKKAAAGAVKDQVNQTIAVWNQMIQKFNALPGDQSVLLRSDFAQADQAFFRLASLYGIKKGQGP